MLLAVQTKLGVPMVQLAELIGVSWRQLMRWKAGDVEIPPWHHQVLTALLGCRAADVPSAIEAHGPLRALVELLAQVYFAHVGGELAELKAELAELRVIRDVARRAAPIMLRGGLTAREAAVADELERLVAASLRTRTTPKRKK